MWLLVSDITAKGNLGRFVRVQPNDVRQLKSKGNRPIATAAYAA